MQPSLAGVLPRSEDLLHFVVVGGGIAGLASAWSLRTAGHRVTLLEQRSTHVLFRCREGVRSTPTMTQIFGDWGIGDQLASISTPIQQMTLLDGKSGEELGLIAMNGKVMETLPADLRCVQYGALFRMIYDLARDSGVHLHFNTKVVSVDPWQAIVTCEDGLQITADVIIGADGTESIVRPVVLGSSAPPPEYDNIWTVSFAVPADLARQDKDLAALLDAQSWTGWLGDDCSMHGILTGPGPGHDYALVMNLTIHDQDAPEEFPLGSESLRMHSFEPRVQKLLKLSSQLNKTLFAHYEPFDNWVHESGKVVLVGEAAHPMIPSWSHNVSMCIEDAMTLSMLFSLPATRSQTPMLLNVYEELRQPRCASVQRYVRRKREVITIPHGPSQRRRDELLRNQRAFHLDDEMDDEFLHITYTGFIQVYGFDACEAVQDWWVKLGRSIFARSPSAETESEIDTDDPDVDLPMLVPIFVDAEVERVVPTYPIISDPLMGDDDHVVREAGAHWVSKEMTANKLY